MNEHFYSTSLLTKNSGLQLSQPCILKVTLKFWKASPVEEHSHRRNHYLHKSRVGKFKMEGSIEIKLSGQITIRLQN